MTTPEEELERAVDMSLEETETQIARLAEWTTAGGRITRYELLVMARAHVFTARSMFALACKEENRT